jgi:hypothetical protein
VLTVRTKKTAPLEIATGRSLVGRRVLFFLGRKVCDDDISSIQLLVLVIPSFAVVRVVEQLTFAPLEPVRDTATSSQQLHRRNEWLSVEQLNALRDKPAFLVSDDAGVARNTFERPACIITQTFGFLTDRSLGFVATPDVIQESLQAVLAGDDGFRLVSLPVNPTTRISHDFAAVVEDLDAVLGEVLDAVVMSCDKPQLRSFDFKIERRVAYADSVRRNPALGRGSIAALGDYGHLHLLGLPQLLELGDGYVQELPAQSEVKALAVFVLVVFIFVGESDFFGRDAEQRSDALSGFVLVKDVVVDSVPALVFRVPSRLAVFGSEIELVVAADSILAVRPSIVDETAERYHFRSREHFRALVLDAVDDGLNEVGTEINKSSHFILLVKVLGSAKCR